MSKVYSDSVGFDGTIQSTIQYGMNRKESPLDSTAFQNVVVQSSPLPSSGNCTEKKCVLFYN